jgi:hypothetical protein
MTTETLELWSFARSDDPITSHKSANDISRAFRSGSQRHQILNAYVLGDFTDEQIGEITGLIKNRSCCYWKRCSELRQMGYIKDTGRTTLSSANMEVMICEITESGHNKLKELNATSVAE